MVSISDLPRRASRALGGAVVVLGLAACQTTSLDESKRLTAEEVRSTFIDREWNSGKGTLLFAKDGSYRYSDHQRKASGSYQIGNDGVLCASESGSGLRTCYTFYRDGNGYRHRDDRSGEHGPVYFRTPVDTTNRLTAEEVRSTFIASEWSEGWGTFMLGSDGSFEFVRGQETWRGTYQMGDDGVICSSRPESGLQTCYTFYRSGDGYRYWHSRSARYWPAYPRTPIEKTNRLTADEVRSIVVGREWVDGNIILLFAKDGSYRRADGNVTVNRTYEVGEDGVLCTSKTGSGPRTCYTFYRDGNGYRYWSSRTGRYSSAQPR